MPARKSHSKERTARISAVVERAQALISNDLGQSLRSDGCSEAVEIVTFGRPYVFQQDGAGCESFDSKLALKQHRYVLVQGNLTSQQLRFKSLGLLCMERS